MFARPAPAPAPRQNRLFTASLWAPHPAALPDPEFRQMAAIPRIREALHEPVRTRPLTQGIPRCAIVLASAAGMPKSPWHDGVTLVEWGVETCQEECPHEWGHGSLEGLLHGMGFRRAVEDTITIHANTAGGGWRA